MARKTIAVDFDGVIHGYESGWKGAGECPDAPVPGAAEFLRAAVADDRFDVIVFSTRAEQVDGLFAIRNYIGGLVGLDVARHINIVSSKPKAVIYIDDRGYRFCGMFPSLDEIDEFKPWNKS